MSRGAAELRSDNPGRTLSWALAALLACCMVRLWVMPLGSSFWVDEMGTAFVVRRGAEDPTLRVAPQVPASIYYVLPAAMDRLFGLSEAAYRLPSLAAMGLALWLIAKLAGRLLSPGAAWFAAFACLLLRGFNYQAADARPYALGTCVLAASLWLLVRWLDTGGWRYAAGYALLAALLWRVHLVFWPAYVIYLAYAAARLARAEAKVGWKAAAGVHAVIGVSLIPVAREALDLMKEAAAHVVVPPPGAKELVYSLKLALAAGAALGALLGARLLGWRGERKPAGASAWVLVLSWWLSMPVMLFAFSWLSGDSVFVPRYLYLALPGAALTATAGAARFIPAEHFRRAALVPGVLALALLGRWDQVWPPHHGSDWRGAARAVNQLTNGRSIAVLCPSPFIEARPPTWNPDYPPDGFLYAHLTVYPIAGRVVPLPFDVSAEAATALLGRLEQLAGPEGGFVLYGPAGGVGQWKEWLEGRLTQDAWRFRRCGEFGDVVVILAERGAVKFSVAMPNLGRPGR